MLYIQIILVVIFVLALLNVFWRWRKNELSARACAGWSLFWILSVLITVRPDSTFYWARLLGVGRGADLVIYAALALLFFLVFRLTVRVERLNKNLTKTVREDALKKL